MRRLYCWICSLRFSIDWRVDIRLLFYERLRLGLIVLDGRLERIALLFELGLLFAQRNKLLFNFL